MNSYDDDMLQWFIKKIITNDPSFTETSVDVITSVNVDQKYLSL